MFGNFTYFALNFWQNCIPGAKIWDAMPVIRHYSLERPCNKKRARLKSGSLTQFCHFPGYGYGPGVCEGVMMDEAGSTVIPNRRANSNVY